MTNSNYSFRKGHQTSFIKHVSWVSYDFPCARASTSPESFVGLIHLNGGKAIPMLKINKHGCSFPLAVGKKSAEADKII